MQRKEVIALVLSALSPIESGRPSHLMLRRGAACIIERAQGLMFPEFFAHPADSGCSAYTVADRLLSSLEEEISRAFSLSENGDEEASALAATEIFRALPGIKKMLLTDAEAIYRGDPAASSREEIILSYPGFFAISVYRLAHEFYTRKIPLLPRLMSEYAHSVTGIDIHPGARIGESFCIDHGTGVVIGETATIGRGVKLYQGVTIGAKSFHCDASGDPIKGLKRHPDIGNDCVIYAGATVLGGDTAVGDNCVIGGNVWLTHSVKSGTTVRFDGSTPGKSGNV